MTWSRLSVIRTALLVICGFASLVTAAFLVHLIAGFAALGLCLLLLEFLTSERPGEAPTAGQAP